MNYTPGKLFADCTHRYVVATPQPEPRENPGHAAAKLAAFMLDIIKTRLLPALAPFPEAHAAYTQTLHQLLRDYHLAMP